MVTASLKIWLRAIGIITPLILCFITFGSEQHVQACGGVYNAPVGNIMSPLYPRHYPSNQDCIYKIYAAAGHRITLTFLSFELEGEQNNCQYDYLEIRDGKLDTSPYMGTYCNTTLYLEQRRSSSNTMWIKFHSDYSRSGAGFQAMYSTERMSQNFFFSTASKPPAIFRKELDIISWTCISPSGLQDPGGIDYDQEKSRIYWTDKAEKTIRSANFDGSDVRLVRNLSLNAKPGGLSVDSLSRLIFYTDAGNEVIAMITLDTNNHRIVISSTLDDPRDIELDKYNGVIYWSDCGASPTIERANYDGTGRQVLVSGNKYLKQPNALALDTGGRLYWADSGTHNVGWVDLQGRNTSVILLKEGSFFCGMDIYQSDLFISDWDNQSINSYIYRYGTDGIYRDVAVSYDGQYNDIRVYAEDREDKGPNGCGNNNGGCSYICIPTPSNTSKCLTDGRESSCGGVYNFSSEIIMSPLYPSQYPSNQDCIYKIYAAAGYRITLTFLSFELEGEQNNCQYDYLEIRDGELDTSPYMGTYCNTTLYLEQRRSSSNTMWIKFHSDSSLSGAGFRANYTTVRIPQKFFFSTGSNPPIIFRKELDISSWTIISPSGLQDPGGIDYDQEKSRIYWTDKAEKTIRSANFDGSDVRLVRNLSLNAKPGGLSVDSLSRLIFYTDAGNKVIAMITLDTNNHRIVINSTLDDPRDIELDKHNGVIYWSDCGASPTIERANYDGTDRQVLVSGNKYLKQPNALALDTGGRLYWADGGTHNVGWVDLQGRNTSVIVLKEGSLFCGMDIYQSDLFISDWDFLNSNQSIKSHVYRYGTDGRYRDVADNYGGQLNDIRVYAEDTEDKGQRAVLKIESVDRSSFTWKHQSQGPTDVETTTVVAVTSVYRLLATEVNVLLMEENPVGDLSTIAKGDDITTDSTMKARDLVTSSSTSDPGNLAGRESASTNTVIIIVVCVMAGVVGITVVVALSIVFKLRRKSDCKQDVVDTRRGNQSNTPLETLPTISNSAFDVVNNIYSKNQSDKVGDNSNDAGERNCERPKTFTKNSIVLHIALEQQAFTPREDYLEDPAYDDLVSSHDTGGRKCKPSVTLTQGERLPYITSREQATAPRDGYSNLSYEEEHVYDQCHSGHKKERVGDEPLDAPPSVELMTPPTKEPKARASKTFG